MSEERVDVIIPLSCESKSNDDELRICLRSIDKYAKDVGKVIVCTTAKVSWLSDNVTILPVADSEKHLKDANLIHKILYAIEYLHITGKVAFFSDDQCLLQSIKLAELPPVFNNRNKSKFDIPLSGRWHKRVLNTFNFLESRGIYLDHNYESHTPQVYDAPSLLKVMDDIDYRTQPGLTVNTLFMGLLGIKGGISQGGVKFTVECENDAKYIIPEDRLFCGYNDAGFSSGLRELLFEHFPEPCKYEK